MTLNGKYIIETYYKNVLIYQSEHSKKKLVGNSEISLGQFRISESWPNEDLSKN